MATYEDKMKDLSALTDEDLSSLESEITEAFNTADEADDLDAMSAAADNLDAVRAEKKARGGDAEAAAPAPDAEAAEPVAADGKPEFLKDKEDEDKKDGVTASADAPVDPAPEATPDADPAPVEPTEGDQPEGDETPETPAPDTESTEASADTTPADATVASANKAQEADVDIPEDRKPVAETARPTVTITAGADISGYQHGTEFRSSGEVSDAFIKRLDSLRNVRGGDGEQILVATVASAAPESRTLVPGKDAENRDKIAAVVELDAPETGIIASGGYCAPLEVRYDIFGLGVADRPIRDALAGFQADRGGIRYTQPPVLADLAGAVGVWTAANDANPTAPTEKPCLIVDCSPELTATLDAVTMCLQFGNLVARAFPELVARNNELGMIQHARLADLTLLNKISALSTKATSSFKLGFARDFLEAVGRGAAAYRARHRMGVRAPLRVFAPAWVKDAMREDFAWSLGGDLDAADTVIESYFRARNVNVTWHLDDASSLNGAQANNAALNAWPSSFKWQIFAEGTFLFLDGGTLDLGIVRDSELVSTNDYKMFVETFEGLAKVGIESVEVTTTTKVVGGVARHIPTDASAETGFDSTP